jgi:predicted amidohydrolase
VTALQSLNLALIQTDTHWHDPEANREMFAPLIAEAAQKADLVALPEMFSTGFTMASAEIAEPMSGPTLSWLADQAQKYDCHLCASLVIEEGDAFYNRFVHVGPDGSRGKYDKRHLFRMAGEHEHYAPGDAKMVFSVGQWRICAMVCYDLRFPVWFRNEGDYDALLVLANWPAARRDAWLTLLRARAIENQAYAAGVNIVGVDGNGVAYSGGTAAYDPDGAVLVERLDDKGIEYVRFDSDLLARRRSEFPVWQDADAFRLQDL